MTITMKNVDASLFEVLKSLVKMKSNVILEEKDDPVENEMSLSDSHIKEINAVYDKIPEKEQTFTCNASKSAVWEMIKDDTW